MDHFVDGALECGLDEVVFFGLVSVLGQGLMSYEVGVCVDQTPLGADEVLVVLRVVSSQESISLLFDPSQLGGVELRFDFEERIHQVGDLSLGDLPGSHQSSLLLQLREIFGVADEHFLCSVHPALDGLGVSQRDLVGGLLEGHVELILADDAKGSDGCLESGIATVGVLEDYVGGNLVTEKVDGGQLSDDVDESASFPCLEEGEAFGDHVVDEFEAFGVLNDFELGAYHSVDGIRVFSLGAESSRDGVAIFEKDRDLLHSVVELGEMEGFFHRAGLRDVGAYVVPGSSTSSHI